MAIGFKEWKLICDALAAGHQSIILRKGGIHEGRAGFEFKHSEFFLFPTWFHTQAEDLRLPGDAAPLGEKPEEIPITGYAKVDWTADIGDWEAAEALEPFHLWKPEIIRERFGYSDTPGLHLAFVRGFRLPVPWLLADRPAFGGCRSWLNLPDEEGAPQIEDLVPVLTDDEHAERADALRRILARSSVKLQTPA